MAAIVSPNAVWVKLPVIASPLVESVTHQGPRRPASVDATEQSPPLRYRPLLLVLLTAAALWIPTVVLQAGCLQREAFADPQSCTSQIQSSFISLSTGLTTPDGSALLFPPLLAGLLLLLWRIAMGLTGTVGTAPDPQSLLDASVPAFSLAAVVLLVCLLAAVFALFHLVIPLRGHGGMAALVSAVAVVVLTAGMSSWALLPVALLASAVAAYFRERLLVAGVLLGLAMSAGMLPAALGLGAMAALALQHDASRLARLAVPTLGTALVAHFPLLVNDGGLVFEYYRSEFAGTETSSSLWQLLATVGLETDHAGSLGLGALLLAVCTFIGYLRSVGRTPRIESVLALIIVAWVLLVPLTPQAASLWVLLAVVLARPRRLELAALTVAQMLLVAASPGWLGGADSESRGHWSFAVAVALWLVVVVWILVHVSLDLIFPSRTDPSGETDRSAWAPTPVAAPWPAWRPALIASAWAVGLTRVMYLGTAYAAEWLFNTDQIKPEFSLDIWPQWDALHFLEIAQNGYGPEVVGGNASAFFPLYPLTIRWVSALGLEPVLAAMLISLVASFVACVYLYRLAELHGFSGQKSVLYLLLFPTAAFLVAPYTEALFLAGAIPAFYYAYRGRPWLTAIFASVAVGSRTVGLFLVAGVAIELVRALWPNVRMLVEAMVAMVLATIPFWAFSWHLHDVRGDFFDSWRAQSEGWGRSFSGFVDGLAMTWNTWDGDYGANHIFTWRVEIIFAALSLALVGWLMWRGYAGYSIYVGATLIVALGNTWYYSNPRLALAFFPFAFLLAAFTSHRETAHSYSVMVLTGFAAVGAVAITQSAWFF